MPIAPRRKRPRQRRLTVHRPAGYPFVVATETEHPTTLATRAIGAADPHDRLKAICALRAELDELEVDAVRGAITSGSSWSQVAEALGVSQQAGHRPQPKRPHRPPPAPRRHAKRLDRPPPEPRYTAEPPPAERVVVTAQARRAVRAARAAARALE